MRGSVGAVERGMCAVGVGVWGQVGEARVVGEGRSVRDVGEGMRVSVVG